MEWVVVPAVGMLALVCLARRRPPRSPRTAAAPVRIRVLAAPCGRPGFEALAPAGAQLTAHAADRGGARLGTLEVDGASIVVRGLSRVGAEHDGLPLPAASLRPVLGRGTDAGPCLQEDVEQVDLATGPAWCRTLVLPHVMRTEVHLDHAGWGFVIVVESTRDHDAALGVAERVLTSWRWLDAAPRAQVAVA